MDDKTVTQDLTRFGYREIHMAGEILTAFKTDKDHTHFIGDGVAVWMNSNSGSVFICDEDYNTAMMNGDVLEDFFSCPICGAEGFFDEVKDHAKGKDGDKECKAWIKDIKKNL